MVKPLQSTVNGPTGILYPWKKLTIEVEEEAIRIDMQIVITAIVRPENGEAKGISAALI